MRSKTYYDVMRLDGSLTERYGLRQVREHPDFTISKVLTVIKWPIITTLTSNHRIAFTASGNSMFHCVWFLRVLTFVSGGLLG